MKNLLLSALVLFVTAACTKSETQYNNQDDKKHTVNDQKSDTIQTLNEVSDTLKTGADSANVKTDNE